DRTSMAPAPPASHSPTFTVSCSARRQATTTAYSSSSSPIATALPMPEPAPVTIATFLIGVFTSRTVALSDRPYEDTHHRRRRVSGEPSDRRPALRKGRPAHHPHRRGRHVVPSERRC